jgi:gluconate 2-dehydrogenase gamma chain
MKKKNALSRRELLKSAGLVVGAAVAQGAQTDPNALRSLTRLEYDTLDAICSRIIPNDETGPGAREAKAARYIDWGLDGYLNTGMIRANYQTALAAVDAHARATKGAAFTALAPADQDAIVTDLQNNRVPGAPQGFFNTVRAHTIDGMFSDPFYGGNANAVGWELIGYPGARIAVPAEYQQWGNKLEQGRGSAYDHAMFRKGVI